MAEKKEATGDFKKENTDNASGSWNSEEWHKAFVIIEKHMDRLFGGAAMHIHFNTFLQINSDGLIFKYIFYQI
ncbi:MAG: hypothetical protein K2K74_17245 [Lachnospiraceae bacterium]|nr:hypothetical protein [Lachnospiraceae bacterium]